MEVTIKQGKQYPNLVQLIGSRTVGVRANDLPLTNYVRLGDSFSHLNCGAQNTLVALFGASADLRIGGQSLQYFVATASQERGLSVVDIHAVMVNSSSFESRRLCAVPLEAMLRMSIIWDTDRVHFLVRDGYEGRCLGVTSVPCEYPTVSIPANLLLPPQSWALGAPVDFSLSITRKTHERHSSPAGEL